jgi:hypothetical protein
MICTPHPICLDDEMKKNKMGEACSTYGGWRDICRVLVGKPEGKKSFGKPRCRLEDI